MRLSKYLVFIALAFCSCKAPKDQGSASSSNANASSSQDMSSSETVEAITYDSNAPHSMESDFGFSSSFPEFAFVINHIFIVLDTSGSRYSDAGNIKKIFNGLLTADVDTTSLPDSIRNYIGKEFIVYSTAHKRPYKAIIQGLHLVSEEISYAGSSTDDADTTDTVTSEEFWKNSSAHLLVASIAPLDSAEGTSEIHWTRLASLSEPQSLAQEERGELIALADSMLLASSEFATIQSNYKAYRKSTDAQENGEVEKGLPKTWDEYATFSAKQFIADSMGIAFLSYTSDASCGATTFGADLQGLFTHQHHASTSELVQEDTPGEEENFSLLDAFDYNHDGYPELLFHNSWDTHILLRFHPDGSTTSEAIEIPNNNCGC